MIDTVTANVDAVMEWTQQCSLNGTNLFKLDSGSQVDIIPESLFKELHPSPQLFPSPLELESYSNHMISPVRQINLRINTGKCTTKATFQVVKGKVAPILGKETCEKAKHLQRVLSVKSEQNAAETGVLEETLNGSLRVKELLKAHEELFNELGSLIGR